MPNAPRPILVFAYGNPSRGDDALGPCLLERLEQCQRVGELKQVELLTDFQLQVEHALDLQGRERVVFVDASASGPAPFSFRPVEPEQDGTYTTHAMSPGAVLRVLEQISTAKPPQTWLLAIRGYRFKLGTPPSEQANRNLAEASGFLAEFLRTPLN